MYPQDLTADVSDAGWRIFWYEVILHGACSIYTSWFLKTLNRLKVSIVKSYRDKQVHFMPWLVKVCKYGLKHQPCVCVCVYRTLCVCCCVYIYIYIYVHVFQHLGQGQLQECVSAVRVCLARLDYIIKVQATAQPSYQPFFMSFSSLLIFLLFLGLSIFQP